MSSWFVGYIKVIFVVVTVGLTDILILVEIWYE